MSHKTRMLDICPVSLVVVAVENSHLRRKLGEPQRIWSEAKIFFQCPTQQTCLGMQEMQKFCFYLIRFKSYRQKTKNQLILGLFDQSYKHGLWLIA